MTSFHTPEEVLTAKDVDDGWSLIVYASQRIGCPRPIGHKKRGMAIKRIKEEREAQRWAWADLAAAVDYMKHRGIKAKSIDFVFYHVEDARKNGFRPRVASSSEGLMDAVAQAVYVETDQQWVRRLLSAKGNALRKVYEAWEAERKPLYEA